MPVQGENITRYQDQILEAIKQKGWNVYKSTDVSIIGAFFIFASGAAQSASG